MITVTLSGANLDEVRDAALSLAGRLGAVSAEAEAPPVIAEPIAATPELTAEFLREYTINNYLNTHFEDAKGRADAFKELLNIHGAEKLTLLPESKFASWYAEVNKRISK